MIERHDDLTRVVDARGPDAKKLACHGPGVVVRHAMVGRERNIVATSDEFSVGKALRVKLDDLLGERLRSVGWEVTFGEEVGRSIGELGRKGVQKFGMISRDSSLERSWPVMEVCYYRYAPSGPWVRMEACPTGEPLETAPSS